MPPYIHPMIRVSQLVLAAMAASYLLPPAVRYVLRRKPPGIIGLTYLLITGVTFVYGILLIDSAAFWQSINEIGFALFSQSKAAAESTILGVAILLSFSFVLANLLRSYFNLHRIEEPEDSDGFATFISKLTGRYRVIEYLLRISVFLAIIGIEVQIHAMQSGLEQAALEQSALSTKANVFWLAFGTMWYTAVGLYSFLLVWDWFLLWRADRADAVTRGVLLWQALPVHSFGLVVAVLLGLAAHWVGWANSLTHFAVVFSLFGSGWLIASLVKDRDIVLEAFSELGLALNNVRKK